MRNNARFARNLAALFCVILVSVLCLAKKEFVLPAAQPAKNYPARDDQSNDKLAVAADPYDMPDKASIFSVRYGDVGFLPIFLVITNDRDQAISLADMKVQLVTVDRTKIDPATEDDIYRRLSRPSATGRPSPLPFPTKKVKGTVSPQTMEEIQRAQFAARAVEPHSTQSGFLFFDVSGISNPLAGARFYLTGVQDAKGNELMYFEIPMEKYLSAPAPPK